MKDYKQLLANYDPNTTHHLTHEWGQSSENVLEQIAALWPEIALGDRIALTSYKHFGIKSAIRFLSDRGFQIQVVGKGPDNLRLVEIIKGEEKVDLTLSATESVSFRVCNKEYEAVVGNAIFSKEGIDLGTSVLLEYICSNTKEFSSIKIADFGAGWGAISLVLADQLPDSEIVAFEKDLSSYNALRANLGAFAHTKALQSDLTAPEASVSNTYRGYFDCIVSNPPFHMSSEEKERFFTTAKEFLKSNGVLLAVIEKPYRKYFKKVLDGFKMVSEHELEGYVIYRLTY